MYEKKSVNKMLRIITIYIFKSVNNYIQMTALTD
jgi:hypothetical protein